MGFPFVITASIVSVFLVACSHSKERMLSKAEKEKLGLTAMIFDVPLCPTKIDQASGKPIVEGACELVTCKQEGGDLVCRAVKENKKARN